MLLYSVRETVSLTHLRKTSTPVNHEFYAIKNIEVTGKISLHELTHSPFKNSQSLKKYLMRKPNKI
jgi:hypothetical protein